MKKRTASVWTGLAVAFLICAIAQTAAGEMTFDPKNYRAMVDASSPEIIPPGTKITLQNWQQYKNFMPTWLQASFRGDYHWKIGPGPEFTILVGPTSNFPMPAIYLRDTEKYHNQVQLEQTPWGGYTIKNYTAGVPFPGPTEPNLAVKVMYNAWLPWRPFVSRYLSYDKLVDSYGNISNEDTDNTFFEMGYLSDEGYPNMTQWAEGYFQAGRYFVTSPEQSKYTTSLQLQPTDPTRLQELYVFLPSLRRSLRLSSAARCTPLLGTDYIADDGAWLPPNFKPTFLGVKKILNLVLDPKYANDSKTYAGGGGVPSGTFPGWPVAGTNHWELRSDYVIDLLALPVLGNYCYSHRVFYIDQQNWITAMAGAENYDRTGKLYKILWTAQAPINLHGVITTYAYSTGMSMAMDFQNQHTTWNNDDAVQIDNDVPAQFRDPINATPAGLARIMK